MKYRNSEGYADPTAGLAMSRIVKEYRQKQKKQFALKNCRKIYVASRYAGDVERNTAFAVNCCRRVIDKGYMPIASHLLYPQMLDDNNPDTPTQARKRLLNTCFIFFFMTSQTPK